LKKCDHNSSKTNCRKCSPQNFCEHNTRRSVCRVCSPKHYCKHTTKSGESKYRGSCQICDPTSWAKRLLTVARRDAAQRNHKPPNLIYQEIVKLRLVSASCCLCGDPLLGRIVLHHDHESGSVFGFAHNKCNILEGFLLGLGLEKAITLLGRVFHKVKK
jgi:hypothetical protein